MTEKWLLSTRRQRFEVDDSGTRSQNNGSYDSPKLGGGTASVGASPEIYVSSIFVFSVETFL